MVECALSAVSTFRPIFLLISAVLLSSCLRAHIPEHTPIEVPPLQKGGVRGSTSRDAIATATAVLKPLSGELGNGFAEVKIFTDESRFSIRTSLPPLEQGEYVAWATSDLLPQPLQIGKLQNPKGDTTYLLQEEGTIQIPPESISRQSWRLTISWEPHESSKEERRPILEGAFTFHSSHTFLPMHSSSSYR